MVGLALRFVVRFEVDFILAMLTKRDCRLLPSLHSTETQRCRCMTTTRRTRKRTQTPYTHAQAYACNHTRERTHAHTHTHARTAHPRSDQPTD